MKPTRCLSISWPTSKTKCSTISSAALPISKRSRISSQPCPSSFSAKKGRSLQLQPPTRAFATRSVRWRRWVETATAPAEYQSICQFAVHCRRSAATNPALAAAVKNIRTAAAAPPNRIPGRLQLQYVAELLRIGHRCFAGEILADVCSRFSFQQ